MGRCTDGLGPSEGRCGTVNNATDTASGVPANSGKRYSLPAESIAALLLGTRCFADLEREAVVVPHHSGVCLWLELLE